MMTTPKTTATQTDNQFKIKLFLKIKIQIIFSKTKTNLIMVLMSKSIVLCKLNLSVLPKLAFLSEADLPVASKQHEIP